MTFMSFTGVPFTGRENIAAVYWWNQLSDSNCQYCRIEEIYDNTVFHIHTIFVCMFIMFVSFPATSDFITAFTFIQSTNPFREVFYVFFFMFAYNLIAFFVFPLRSPHLFKSFINHFQPFTASQQQWFILILHFLFNIDYRIWPNYRTYPYKGTVKQFCSLQITASVFLSTVSLYRHMLWVPMWIASICWCNSNEYPQDML